MLAAGDLPAVRDAADELSTISDVRDVPLLYAVSMHATGPVRPAEGDARGALAPLRRARTAWQELEVPYELEFLYSFSSVMVHGVERDAEVRVDYRVGVSCCRWPSHTASSPRVRQV